MTKPPLADVPVRSAEELTHRWETMLDPPVFGARSLWLSWFDDGLMLPVVIPVDDVPAVPDRALLANLASVLESVTETHCAGIAHLAMALCRPGRLKVTKDDEAWARGLREAFDGDRAAPGACTSPPAGQIVSMVEAPESTWGRRDREVAPSPRRPPAPTSRAPPRPFRVGSEASRMARAVPHRCRGQREESWDARTLDHRPWRSAEDRRGHRLRP